MKRFHRAWAAVFGYFWLPCPMCGEMFGGHQVGVHSIRVTGDERNVKRVCCKRHDSEIIIQIIPVS